MKCFINEKHYKSVKKGSDFINEKHYKSVKKGSDFEHIKKGSRELYPLGSGSMVFEKK